MKKVIVILLVIFLAVNAAIFGTMEERIKIEEKKPRVTLIAPFANEAYWGSIWESAQNVWDLQKWR